MYTLRLFGKNFKLNTDDYKLIDKIVCFFNNIHKIKNHYTNFDNKFNNNNFKITSNDLHDINMNKNFCIELKNMFPLFMNYYYRKFIYKLNNFFIQLFYSTLFFFKEFFYFLYEIKKLNLNKKSNIYDFGYFSNIHIDNNYVSIHSNIVYCMDNNNNVDNNIDKDNYKDDNMDYIDNNMDNNMDNKIAIKSLKELCLNKIINIKIIYKLFQNLNFQNINVEDINLNDLDIKNFKQFIHNFIEIKYHNFIEIKKQNTSSLFSIRYIIIPNIKNIDFLLFYDNLLFFDNDNLLLRCFNVFLYEKLQITHNQPDVKYNLLKVKHDCDIFLNRSLKHRNYENLNNFISLYDEYKEIVNVWNNLIKQISIIPNYDRNGKLKK
jgi:hypothetical protein